LNYHADCGLDSTEKGTLLANYETLHRYYPISAIMTSLNDNWASIITEVMKEIQRSVLINQKANMLEAQVCLSGEKHKAKRLYSTKNRWIISMQFLNWLIKPKIMDRETAHSATWLFIQKIDDIHNTYAVTAKQEFISGETIGIFCGMIIMNSQNARISKYAIQTNGYIIDPMIGFYEIINVEWDVIHQYYGMGLHHVAYTNNIEESNARLSNQLVVSASKKLKKMMK
jgi:hypothetical protein